MKSEIPEKKISLSPGKHLILRLWGCRYQKYSTSLTEFCELKARFLLYCSVWPNSSEWRGMQDQALTSYFISLTYHHLPWSTISNIPEVLATAIVERCSGNTGIQKFSAQFTSSHHGTLSRKTENAWILFCGGHRSNTNKALFTAHYFPIGLCLNALSPKFAMWEVQMVLQYSLFFPRIQ